MLALGTSIPLNHCIEYSEASETYPKYMNQSRSVMDECMNTLTSREH